MFFPFDSQSCEIILGSWNSDSSVIDYRSLTDQISTSNYIENNGWDLIDTSIERFLSSNICIRKLLRTFRVVKLYRPEDSPWVELHFHVVLEIADLVAYKLDLALLKQGSLHLAFFYRYRDDILFGWKGNKTSLGHICQHLPTNFIPP
jgi:hypothetical protein